MRLNRKMTRLQRRKIFRPEKQTLAWLIGDRSEAEFVGLCMNKLPIRKRHEFVANIALATMKSLSDSAKESIKRRENRH